MEFKDISGPLPPAIGGDEKPEYPTEYPNEEARIKAEQRKRWQVIEKIRNRKRRDARVETQRDRQRLERFRKNYEIAAHIIIDAIADVEPDAEKREARRTKLERRMRVRKMPRITGPMI